MTDESIKAELKALARDCLNCDGSATAALTRTLLANIREKYGEEHAEWTYDVMTILRCQEQSNTNFKTVNGNIFMNSHNVTAGRDAIGNAVGNENKIEIGDISLYNQQVEQAGMNPELATALKEGRESLTGLKVSEDVMKSVMENYGKLTIELQKPTPSAELVKLFWAPIQMFGAGIAKIAALGPIIGKVFGISLGVPPAP